MDVSSILGNVHRLVGLDSLPPAEFVQDLRNFIRSFRRVQYGHGPADNFPSRIPVDVLRPRVPGGDDAIQTFPNDRIF